MPMDNTLHWSTSSTQPTSCGLQGILEIKQLKTTKEQLYCVSQKKAGTADFQYLAGQKCHFLTSFDETSSAEENDAKIVKFDWVILNLCTLLEIQSFSNFAGFWGTDERRILAGQTIHMLSCGSPLFRVSFVATDQRASTKHRMEGLSRHNSSLTGCKNRVKFENDRLSRNGHRIKLLNQI